MRWCRASAARGAAGRSGPGHEQRRFRRFAREAARGVARAGIARLAGPAVSAIPLFPLNIVLFPGRAAAAAHLRNPLRRHGAPLHARGPRLRRGVDSRRQRGGMPETDIYEVGTMAEITDFHQLPDGLLGLSCVGRQRFRILERSRQADGLNLAEVEWLDGEPSAGRAAAACAPGGTAAHGAAAAGRGLHGHRDAARRCGVGGPPPGGNLADPARPRSNSIWRSTIPLERLGA